VTAAYYRGADGIVLTYDCTSMESFDHVEEWLSEVSRHASESCRKLLIGNKIDLVDSKEVSTDSGQRFADKIDVPFVECSAKSGAGMPLIALSFPRICMYACMCRDA
jgi:Ras-related protein Rab-1A